MNREGNLTTAYFKTGEIPDFRPGMDLIAGSGKMSREVVQHPETGNSGVAWRFADPSGEDLLAARLVHYDGDSFERAELVLVTFVALDEYANRRRSSRAVTIERMTSESGLPVDFAHGFDAYAVSGGVRRLEEMLYMSSEDLVGMRGKNYPVSEERQMGEGLIIGKMDRRLGQLRRCLL